MAHVNECLNSTAEITHREPPMPQRQGNFGVDVEPFAVWTTMGERARHRLEVGTVALPTKPAIPHMAHSSAMLIVSRTLYDRCPRDSK